jgi:hypothetical protein
MNIFSDVEMAGEEVVAYHDPPEETENRVIWGGGGIETDYLQNANRTH